tara:strand:- start:425 stop:640 length:216 start_codon:yes stop_codon:yes gene_type:complete
VFRSRISGTNHAGGRDGIHRTDGREETRETKHAGGRDGIHRTDGREETQGTKGIYEFEQSDPKYSDTKTRL